MYDTKKTKLNQNTCNCVQSQMVAFSFSISLAIESSIYFRMRECDEWFHPHVGRRAPIEFEAMQSQWLHKLPVH